MAKRPADAAGLSDDHERDRERLRVSKACDRCKRKKTKCDGLNPCWACEKSKLVCGYSVSGSTATASPVGIDGSKDVSKDYYQPPPPMSLQSGVINSNGGSSSSQQQQIIPNGEIYHGNNNEMLIGKLVDRIRVLEGMLEKQNKGEDGSKQHSFSPANDNLFWETLNFHSLSSLKCRHTYTRRYIMYLTNVFSRQIWDGLSPGNQKKITSLPRIQGYGWNMSGIHYLKHNAISPPRITLEPELEKFLVDYFFDHVNPLLAILHKPVFLKQYNFYRNNTDEKGQCRLFTANLYVACALAMRFSEIAGVRKFPSGLEEEIFTDGYQTLQSFVFQWESFEIVQGLLLASQYLRTCHRQASTWTVLGQAQRLAYALGLMRTGLYSARTGYEAQKATRIFWCCFTIDRLCTLDTGRSGYFKDNEIAFEPVTEYVDDGWLTPTAFGLIRLALIVNRCPNDLGAEYDQMKYGLTESVANELENLDEYMDREFGLGPDADATLNSQITTSPKPDQETVCEYRLLFHEASVFLYQIPLFGMLETERKDIDTSLRDKENILGTAKAIVKCVDTLCKLHGGRINSAWYSIMHCNFSACLMLLVLLNSGTFAKQEIASYLSKALHIIDVLASDGRYAMAKECQWALRSINHLLYLKMRENCSVIEDLGIDPGDPEVNKRHFASLGLYELQNQKNAQGADYPPEKGLDPEENDDSGDAFTAHHNREESSTARNGITDPSFAMPLGAAPTASNGDGYTKESNYFRMSEQPPFDDPDLASSVGWFDSWTFDIESSVASYLDNFGPTN